MEFLKSTQLCSKFSIETLMLLQRLLNGQKEIVNGAETPRHSRNGQMDSHTLRFIINNCLPMVEKTPLVTL